MMQNKIEGFSFTDWELFYFFSNHPNTMILGFTNPTLGLLINEINENLKKARDSLISKGLLDQVNYHLRSSKLIRFLNVLIEPDHCVVVLFNQEKKSPSYLLSYHYKNSLVIELRGSDEGIYILNEISDGKVINRQILDLFPINNINLLDGQPMNIPTEVIQELWEKVSKGEVLDINDGSSQNLAAQTSYDQLITAIQNHGFKLSLLVFKNSNKPTLKTTTGFSLVYSESEVWLLELDEKENNLTQARQISKTTLEKKIDIILP